jgi:hypothetical protein
LIDSSAKKYGQVRTKVFLIAREILPGKKEKVLLVFARAARQRKAGGESESLANRAKRKH